jgi:hypothetical protein
MANSKKQQDTTPTASQEMAMHTMDLLMGYLVRKCRHLYYRIRESVGDHKRDIVVCRVEEACDSLEETKVQFEDALERFRELIRAEQGVLDVRYKILKHQLEISQGKTNIVHERILSIEEVSQALFLEWEEELKEYTNRSLRAQSRSKLKSSRQHYLRLMKALHTAEDKIQPVLSAFKDQVLFLKHNLNAQAIAALQHEVLEIGIDISQLIEAMEKSIEEANGFVMLLVEQRALPLPSSK